MFRFSASLVCLFALCVQGADSAPPPAAKQGHAATNSPGAPAVSRFGSRKGGGLWARTGAGK